MSETYKRREVHHEREMAGGAWKDVVEELLRSEVDRRSATGSKGGKVPLTVFLSEDGAPSCWCHIIIDSDGEVCICYGQCGVDPCAEVAPLPHVVK